MGEGAHLEQGEGGVARNPTDGDYLIKLMEKVKNQISKK